jgi:hypothetical protein
MLSIRSERKYRFVAATAAVIVACLASPAAAQDPNTGKITLTGGIDFANAYMFRGLRQDDTGMIMWPFADLGIAVYESGEGVRNVSVNLGTWNSLHTGSTGSDGPRGELWYESDFYTTLGLGFDYGVTLSTTYTAYTSPNNSFSTVKEIAFKVAVDDSGAPAGVVLKPYALLAFEVATSPGLGQADGGLNAGRYLEVGVAPGVQTTVASVAFPVKVGMSLGDYYELAGVDRRFGYFSVGATAAVPLGGTTSYGTWNVHGGIEFQSLGDTPEAFNSGDQTKLIASIGVGLTY